MYLEAGTGLVLLARRDLQRSLAEAVEAPERRRGQVGRHCVVARPQANPHEGLQPCAGRPREPVHVREGLLEDPASEASPDGIRTDTGLQKLGASDKATLPSGQCLPLHNTILELFFCFTTHSTVKQDLDVRGPFSVLGRSGNAWAQQAFICRTSNKLAD